MIEIRCSCCGLLLGEAEQAVEIVCPLCVELRSYVFLFANGYGNLQRQWDQDVFVKNRETEDMICGMLETRKIVGAIE